jgi:hypothetical protein
MERSFAERGQILSDVPLDAMEEEWQRVKAAS